MIKKILIPIDGSEQADKALNLTLDLARKYNSEVEILHVVPPIPAYITSTVNPKWLKEYHEEAKKEGRKLLSESIKQAQSKAKDLKISSNLSEGRPSNNIVEKAENEDFDLIVMGSRGLGGVKGSLLGSVSNQVVNETKIPILLVK
jgi:nucleotide-binding universal stress UspA family protein